MMASASVMKLSLEIARCPLVTVAKNDSAHACSSVVKEQTSFRKATKMHLPEPWIGNLEKSRVLGISSNPGLNTDDSSQGEIFPTADWADEAVVDFFINRIGDSQDNFVTFNNSTEPNFLTKSHDGQFRSAHSNPKTPQKTWAAIHNRMLEIIGDSASPLANYALTEIVHCKSSDAKGVKKAAATCGDKWLERIVAQSPAPVILLLGSHARDLFAKLYGVPAKNFGSGTGYNQMSPSERAFRDLLIVDIGGSNRLVVFNFHNGSSCFQNLEAVYGPVVLKIIRQIAHGEVEVPSDAVQLQKLLIPRMGKGNG